jgi:hypothetical protein
MSCWRCCVLVLCMSDDLFTGSDEWDQPPVLSMQHSRCEESVLMCEYRFEEKKEKSVRTRLEMTKCALR